MSRIQTRNALISYGGLRCHYCNKRLNRKNLNYHQIQYPTGPKEMVPICREHGWKKKQKTKGNIKWTQKSSFYSSYEMQPQCN